MLEPGPPVDCQLVPHATNRRGFRCDSAFSFWPWAIISSLSQVRCDFPHYFYNTRLISFHRLPPGPGSALGGWPCWTEHLRRPSLHKRGEFLFYVAGVEESNVPMGTA